MTEMIKLTNGKEVPLEEFITWSLKKQISSLRVWTPERKLKIAQTLKSLMTPEERKRRSERAKLSSTSEGRKRKSEAAKAAMTIERRKQSSELLSKLKSKPIMTPHGRFNSGKAVAEAAGVTYGVLRQWMKKYPESYYYLPKE